MNDQEREALELVGIRVGDAEDFLGLTPEESQLINLRLALRLAVRRLREARGLTQEQLGTLMNSTQSRVARIESGALGVSLDLMVRAFFALGGKLAELAESPPQPASGRKARA